MTQPTFFGASVIGYECSVGWNEQSSQLVVNLVEDPANGDSFVEPTVGMPCYFNHNGWIFGGIVQSWEAYQDPARTFSIMVVDPREILGNISVVIGGYLGGTLNIPNFINPYGYLENTFGLGFADV